MKSDGERVGRKYVASIMSMLGLKSKTVKKYKATTNSKHNLPVADNLLLRERAEQELINPKTGKKLDKDERAFVFVNKNEAWVSEITYIFTDDQNKSGGALGSILVHRNILSLAKITRR